MAFFLLQSIGSLAISLQMKQTLVTKPQCEHGEFDVHFIRRMLWICHDLHFVITQDAPHSEVLGSAPSILVSVVDERSLMSCTM